MKKFSITLLCILCMSFLISGCNSTQKQADKRENNRINEVELKDKLIKESDMKSIKDTINMKDIDNLEDKFSTNDDWFCYNADISFQDNKGSIKSDKDGTSEAWYKYDKSFKAKKDFMISAKVKVPTFWDSYNKKDAQVGAGVFIGKKGNEGKLVYESDLCVISKDVRFVQGQMIKNRKGGEPVKVDFKKVEDESGVLSILYSNKDKVISLFFNNEVIGIQKIDNTGAVDWEMKDEDEFVVGIMGFSELTNISLEYPSIENVKISE